MRLGFVGRVVGSGAAFQRNVVVIAEGAVIDPDADIGNRG